MRERYGIVTVSIFAEPASWTVSVALSESGRLSCANCPRM
jgi:hypothetical protein